MISCKIRVAGKLLNFPTVEYPQSKFPIKLPRTVANLLSTLLVHSRIFYSGRVTRGGFWYHLKSIKPLIDHKTIVTNHQNTTKTSEEVKRYPGFCG